MKLYKILNHKGDGLTGTPARYQFERNEFRLYHRVSAIIMLKTILDRDTLSGLTVEVYEAVPKGTKDALDAYGLLLEKEEAENVKSEKTLGKICT